MAESEKKRINNASADRVSTSADDPRRDAEEFYIGTKPLSEQFTEGDDPIIEELFPEDGRGSRPPKHKKRARRQSVISPSEPGGVSQESIRESAGVQNEFEDS